MKRLISAVLMLAVISIGLAGCSEKASTTKKTETSTQGGKTQTEQSTTVKQSGENPPPPAK